jgi:ribosome maturation factor RimP
MSVAEQVRRIVEPLLAQQGLECFDVEFGGGRLVVMADRPGGIDLDALTEATRAISFALDEQDPVPGHYVLEVSSPGLERRLRTPDHFRRFVGETLSIKLVATAEGPRRLTGRLERVEAGGIIVDGRTIAFADIDRAQTIFEWGPSPKPGKARPGKPVPGKPKPDRSPRGPTSPAEADRGQSSPDQSSPGQAVRGQSSPDQSTPDQSSPDNAHHRDQKAAAP